MQRSGRHLATVRQRLLSWYEGNRRNLPWRNGRDPYRIWIAEIMLQQTRIQAVLPYYARFLKRFPNVHALARAPQTEVLRLWAGLGYYSRARLLHRAAKQVVRRYRGAFPRDPELALALPGVGRYTAAAILSIAYQEPLAVLDGNVARVLARLYAIRGDLRAPRRWRNLTRISQELLPVDAPGDWNQALMEMGETLCLPRGPRCTECPLQRACRAFALGMAESLPAPRKKRATEPMRIAAAVLLDPQGRTLMFRDPGRHDAPLFSRLWQFPALQVGAEDPAGELACYLRDSFGISIGKLSALPPARHSVTFRRITLVPFLARMEGLPGLPGGRILRLGNLAQLPISNATRKIAHAALSAVGR